MKHSYLCGKLVLFFFILQSLSSCVKPGFDVYQGPADLTITNLTTGSSIRKTSTITIGGKPEELELHHGDRIELLFLPPEKYENKDFDVDFYVFNQVYTVSEKPYILELTVDDNVAVGSSIVTCSAMCRIWQQQSSCKQGISVVVVE